MLKVTVVKGVPDVVIKLEGSLDMGTGHSLQRTVEELDLDRIHNLTVSLSGLDIIDSTGIGQLIGYHRILSRKNGRVLIENDNREIEEILGLIGVREILGS
ncbi:MAG: STAS domain-containing protein [Limnochordia bacterium]|jgi:anti-anti-sigma factor|nr:STAS domain-containing protein [Bacillota bacterium]NLL07871.1 STAS domain-containing protein [Bacillota bacterium]